MLKVLLPRERSSDLQHNRLRLLCLCLSWSALAPRSATANR
jgi:hypothetical protein